MVIGGFNGAYLQDVEVIPLSPTASIPECMRNVAPLPTPRAYTAAAILGGGE